LTALRRVLASATGELALLAALTVACLAPFASKPLHEDDPLFFWSAQRIVAHPLDPYGFDVDWYVSWQPMAQVTQNPPATSYFMALAGLVGGWSPVALHVAFLLPALGVVLGTWLLARRFSTRPLLSGLLVLASPGFVVSATTLMSDVPMLALWMLAAALWVEGIDGDRTGLRIAAIVAAAACVLTKYAGIAIGPLLLVYGLARRGVGRWLVELAPLPLVVLAYQAWTRMQYGEAHLSGAIAYARENGGASLHDGLIALSFLGGSALVAAPLAPLVAGGPTTVVAALAAAAAAAALVVGGASWWTAGWQSALAPVAAHFGPFVFAGVAILGLAALDVRRRRDAAAAMLALWVGGIVVFAGFLNWTTNVRAVLPAIPAVAVLLARAADHRLGAAPLPGLARVTIALALAVGLWVARGDAALAGAQVRAADVVHRMRSGRGPLWFMGHLGFQAAMQDAGARPFDAEKTVLYTGDVVVVPANNTGVVALPESMPKRIETVEVPVGGGGTTMSGPRGAGFYSSIWGPLPYRLDPPPPERFWVVDVVPPAG
jgi:hypothetical protein